MPHADVDISPIQRVISASVGALMTTLLVTPLDVTKIRMQVQESELVKQRNQNLNGLSDCQLCEQEAQKNKTVNNVKIKLNVDKTTKTAMNTMQTLSSTSNRAITVSRLNNNYYLFSNGLMDHVIPTSKLRIEVYESACKHLQPFKHSADAFLKIARYEGVSHLYTGLGVTLWMAAPATVLYYSTYDLLRNYLLKFTNKHRLNTNYNQRLNNGLTTMMPLISGMCGRLFAVTCISPLELMRTQMMARTINRDLSIFQAFKLNLGHGGFLSLWKGLIPSLWRDVPFSGVYWMMYEYFKDYFIQRKLLQKGIITKDYTNDSVGSRSLWSASFRSGALSGSIATFLTQPFDVIKTRRQATLLGIPTKQSDVDKKGLLSLGRSIIQNEGIQGLYVGMPARITRVPIACAIMVSTYEVGKILLKSSVVDDD